MGSACGEETNECARGGPRRAAGRTRAEEAPYSLRDSPVSYRDCGTEAGWLPARDREACYTPPRVSFPSFPSVTRSGGDGEAGAAKPGYNTGRVCRNQREQMN